MDPIACRGCGNDIRWDFTDENQHTGEDEFDEEGCRDHLSDRGQYCYSCLHRFEKIRKD